MSARKRRLAPATAKPLHWKILKITMRMTLETSAKPRLEHFHTD
jgi:hypothetical protein